MGALFLFHACSNFVRGIYFPKRVTVHLICMVFQNNEWFSRMYSYTLFACQELDCVDLRWYSV